MAGTRRLGARQAAHCFSLAVLLSIVPGAMAGQVAIQPDAGNDEAGAAHRKAWGLLAGANTDDWPAAAALLEEAAAARAPGDSVAVVERTAAAQLFFLTGSLERAQNDLESAARQAVTQQWPFLAADLLLKAALVAQDRGLPSDAIEYVRGAESIARSPLVTPEQLAKLRARIRWEPSDPRLRHSET